MKERIPGKEAVRLQGTAQCGAADEWLNNRMCVAAATGSDGKWPSWWCLIWRGSEEWRGQASRAPKARPGFQARDGVRRLGSLLW